MKWLGGGALLATLIAACSSPEAAPAATPAFPADYADSYVEVRGCRKSADHELEFVRVLANPSALAPYSDRAAPFSDGAVVLKEQYEASDDTCAGPIAQWTVMVKSQAASDRLGWDWQRVTAERRVSETNTPSCISCHTSCSGPPQPGYDFTCTDP